ncbi:DUF2203 family protein [Candidatus Woesearchaeota archaeon]|nr:DUF2203 family protein [Candidatus Woesearchaeota archaeon]
MQYPVYYSLEEARLLLPIVEEKIIKILKTHKALELLSTVNIENEEAEQELDLMITKLNMNYYKRLFFYHKYIAELLTIGVVIKDIKKGLVDFNAKHEGRDIYLCWHLGEQDIRYWHEIGDGFTGRQPITLLDKKSV